jgi:hypothetical protein
MSLTNTTSTIISCRSSVTLDADPIDVLYILSINLKEPDKIVIIPYQRNDDDVTFGETTVLDMTDEEFRSKVANSFLHAESLKFLHKNPNGDTDAYVDSLQTLFPNATGSLK